MELGESYQSQVLDHFTGSPEHHGREGKPSINAPKGALSGVTETAWARRTKGLNTEEEGRRVLRILNGVIHPSMCQPWHTFDQALRVRGENVTVLQWLPHRLPQSFWTPGHLGPAGQVTGSLTISVATIPGHPKAVSAPDTQRAQRWERWWFWLWPKESSQFFT